MTNEILLKIAQPDEGWNWNYLKRYGFNCFYNKMIRQHYKIALKIFNEYVPYFYIPENDIKYIIFDDDIYNKVVNDARIKYQAYFGKDLFSYSNFTFGYIVTTKTNWHNLDNIESVVHQAKDKKDLIKLYDYDFAKTNPDDYGIYGIYKITPNQTEELIYIGMTTRSFRERWLEHKNIIAGEEMAPLGMRNTYKTLIAANKNSKLVFRPIINVRTLPLIEKLTRRDLEAMELALITACCPEANQAGLTHPYQFTSITES